MRYALTAQVDSEIHLSGPVNATRDHLLVEFGLNLNSRLNEITISISILEENVREFEQSITTNLNFEEITIRRNEQIRKQLIEELQTLESDLAFATMGALQAIHWDRPTERLIPETLDEEKLVSMSGYSVRKDYPSLPVHLAPDYLETLVQKSPFYRSLKVLKAFWREGMNEFRSFRYVQAFYNFYFVIEGLYADGKSSESRVLEAFQRSPEFTEICQKVLNDMVNQGHHAKRLHKLLSDMQCEPTINGLQKFLFHMRGNLLHYSTKGNRLKGTPFNQDEFESLALLGQSIATLAVGYQEAQISQSM